jgi:hypothetical protein
MKCPLRCYTGEVLSGIIRSFLWVRNLLTRIAKKKKKRINILRTSSSHLTTPLAAAGFIINLPAVSHKYGATGSAAYILQFTSIFLQISLYAASNFLTLSDSNILFSTLSSGTFSLPLRLFLNATHKNTHIIVLYILTCASSEKKLKEKTC